MHTRTIRTYRLTLDKFVAWLREHDVADVESITPTHIRLYLSEADKGGAKASYTHAKIIKTWLRFLSNEDLFSANPIAKVTMHRLDKEILPAFAPEDVRKLLDACDNLRDQALVLLMLDTGCRAAELVTLTVGDIQLKTGAVNIKQGSGRKDRIAFAGAKSLRALHKYMASRPDAKPDTTPRGRREESGPPNPSRLSSSQLAMHLSTCGWPSFR
jgi:integrase/recombinase XerD